MHPQEPTSAWNARHPHEPSRQPEPSIAVPNVKLQQALASPARSTDPAGGELCSAAKLSTPSLQGRRDGYEKPSDADLCLETVDSDPADNARRIVDALERG
jgi:hypothetical protein